MFPMPTRTYGIPAKVDCTRNFEPLQRRDMTSAKPSSCRVTCGATRPLLSAAAGGTPGTFSEREEAVVSMRFGLGDGQPKTLGEIGKVYGVTRERIRQIESKTMSKLRHPSRSQVLRDYLD